MLTTTADENLLAIVRHEPPAPPFNGTTPSRITRASVEEDGSRVSFLLTPQRSGTTPTTAPVRVEGTVHRAAALTILNWDAHQAAIVAVRVADGSGTTIALAGIDPASPLRLVRLDEGSAEEDVEDEG